MHIEQNQKIEKSMDGLIKGRYRGDKGGLWDHWGKYRDDRF